MSSASFPMRAPIVRLIGAVLPEEQRRVAAPDAVMGLRRTRAPSTMPCILGHVGWPWAAMGNTMDHYVGIDVSLEHCSICVVDATGRIVRELKAVSEPEVLSAALKGLH